MGFTKNQWITISVAIMTLALTLFTTIYNHKPETPDFSISVTPIQGQVKNGGAIQAAVTIERMNGYDKDIMLNSIKQPPGVITSFSNMVEEVSPTYKSNLMINVDKSVLTGTYAIQINGQGGDGKTHSTNYTLNVVHEENAPIYIPATEPEIEINYDSSIVSITETLSGTAKNVPEGYELWILVYPYSAQRYYPQNESVNIQNEKWSISVGIGAEDNDGQSFDIIAVLANQTASEEFKSYMEKCATKGSCPGLIKIPSGAKVYDNITVTREIINYSTPENTQELTSEDIQSISTSIEPKIEINYDSSIVSITETLSGTAKNVPEGYELWILVYPYSAQRYYPQNESVNIQNEKWSIPVGIGAEDNDGQSFDIIAVLANQTASEEFKSYMEDCTTKDSCPGLIKIPSGAKVYDNITVTREIINYSTPEDLPNTVISNFTGMEFVLIPSGEFEMGSNEDGSEQPIHQVTIEKAFYLGKCEVTQAQWVKVMGNNPCYFKGEDLPIGNVSWYQVQEFIDKLNAIEKTTKYRLPSESEWEYACRAGTNTRYSFGDTDSLLGDYAWYISNSKSRTYEVGSLQPNAWGLYDMHGNVIEWVQDKWHWNYDGAPTDGSAWEEGTESSRVRRGGSESCEPLWCRSAFRGPTDPSDSTEFDSDYGFRLVMEV